MKATLPYLLKEMLQTNAATFQNIRNCFAIIYNRQLLLTGFRRNQLFVLGGGGGGGRHQYHTVVKETR